MKKIKKTSIILCSILCFFAIVMIGYTAENEKNVHEETGATVEGKTLVIGDDILKVYYDEDTKSLQATEQNGYTWNSVVTDELYSSDKLNENWQKNTKSIFHLSYAEISDVNPTIKTAYSYNADIDASEKDGKIYLKCDFQKEGIALTVIFGVENGEMVVSVPSENITEKKDNKLLAIEMLPYFWRLYGCRRRIYGISRWKWGLEVS